MTKTHKMYGTPTYKSWASMKERCNTKKEKTQKNYFDRGITYPKKWEKFEGFLEDMGVRPDGTTLDRIDTNSNYSKENCRWATWTVQQRNRRNNRKFKGKTLGEWSEITGIKRSTLAQRLYVYGWSVDRALSTTK